MTLPSATRVDKPTRFAITTAVWVFFALVVVLGPAFAYAISVADAGEATRAVLYNISRWLRWPLYVAALVVFIIAALGPVRRARLWAVGRPEERWDRVWERAKVFLIYGLGQGRLTNDLYASIMHLCIFWGWVVLFIGTITIAIHADFVYFLQGGIYLAYSVILDVFGLLALIGLSLALLRRHVLKPEKLRSEEHT